MARTFNGSTQYLTLASALGLTAESQFWFSGWFWRDNLATATAAFSIGASGSNNGRRAISGTAGWAAISTANGGSTQTTGAVTPSAGGWFHILGKWNGTASRDIALNGGTFQSNSTASSGSTQNEIRIGAIHTGSQFLAGRAAYIAIYSGAPTTQEVTDLSGLGVPADALHPSLVAADRLLAYWDLDGTSDPEPDGVGSNDFTLVGSPGSAASPAIQLSAGGGGGALILPQGFWL